MALDRLAPLALTWALLGPRRRHRARHDGSPSRKVRGYRAHRTAAQQKAWVRNRIRAVAVAGKTACGASRPDGARVRLLGVVEHGTGPDGRRLPDHVEVDAKHNEVTHFTGLLAELDLIAVAVTFDALHTVRATWTGSSPARTPTTSQ